MAEIRNLDDVGMADVVDRAGLVEKARHDVLVRGDLRGKHLDGGPASNQHMLGPVDLAHAALAQQSGHAELAKGLTDDRGCARRSGQAAGIHPGAHLHGRGNAGHRTNPIGSFRQ